MSDRAPFDARPLDAHPTDVRLVPAALTAWLVTALGILTPLAPVLTVAGVLAAVAVLVVRRRLPARATAVVLAMVVVGTGFAAAITLRTNAVRDHPLAEHYGGTAEVTLTPSENPRPLGNGRLMFRATLDRLARHETGGMVTVFAAGLPFAQSAAGRPMRFRARISRPKRRDLTVATLTAAGDPVFGTGSAVQRAAGAVQRGFAAAAREALPSDQAAMLPGLVLGDTSMVSAATTAQFRAAGLTHLTAVSGANVTIVCGTALLTAVLVGPRAAVGLAALTLTAFVVVVQPTASVLRAAVMGAVALLAVLTARRRQAIPALAATVLMLLIAAPQLAVEAGFALSVCATAALVVIAPVWSRRLTARGWPKPLADAVSIAVAAQLVTAPLIAGISGSLSLVSVAANLAVAPMVAPITVLGTAAAAVAVYWPAGAQLLIRFCGPAVWWLLSVARWAAGTPGATVPVPSGAAGVLLVGLSGAGVTLMWRTRWRLPLLVVLGGAALAWAIADMSGPRGTIVG